SAICFSVIFLPSLTLFVVIIPFLLSDDVLWNCPSWTNRAFFENEYQQGCFIWAIDTSNFHM
ncbi:hypothetical protein, partial [Vibrio anguillarum]